MDSDEYVFSPGYTAHDDGVDLCFYSVRRTSGSVLRGLAAEMARALLAAAGPDGRFSVSVFATDPWGVSATRWLGLVRSLANLGILVAEPEVQDTRPFGTVVVCSADDRTSAALADVGIDNLAARADELDAAIGQAGLVALADRDFDVRLHRRVNTVALSNGVPAVYLRVLPRLVELGPFVLPGESPCFECYWSRLQAPVVGTGPGDWVAESPFTAFRETGPMAETVWRLGIQLLATEVIRITTPNAGTPATIAKIVRLDPVTLTVARHRVPEVPGCAYCRLVR